MHRMTSLLRLAVNVLVLGVMAHAQICSPHDDSDIGVAACEDWCNDPTHCPFCKCRRCSMCKRPCSSTASGDLGFESCETWCTEREHCSMCKCAGCDMCKGHHPERACTAKVFIADDTPFESCQGDFALQFKHREMYPHHIPTRTRIYPIMCQFTAVHVCVPPMYIMWQHGVKEEITVTFASAKAVQHVATRPRWRAHPMRQTT